MKIIIVGASGKIGREVDKALSGTHEIVRVGATSGDVQCDYTSGDSVRRMFEEIGSFDGLVAVAGRDSTFKKFNELNDEDYRYGFERKFLGQVRLLEIGQASIRDDGCFVFTSGFLSHYPNPFSIATGPLNAAIDTFVQNTAPLLPRGIRINIVSPAPVVDPGQEGRGVVTAAQCAEQYVEAIEGTMSGHVFRAWGGLTA
jgi:NAD(P)-dependent dehydrogenase (short-subunit alcohol dehydrogenase family)